MPSHLSAEPFSFPTSVPTLVNITELPDFLSAHGFVLLRDTITGELRACQTFFGRVSHPVWLILARPVLATIFSILLPILLERLLEDTLYRVLLCVCYNRCRCLRAPEGPRHRIKKSCCDTWVQVEIPDTWQTNSPKLPTRGKQLPLPCGYEPGEEGSVSVFQFSTTVIYLSNRFIAVAFQFIILVQ